MKTIILNEEKAESESLTYLLSHIESLKSDGELPDDELEYLASLRDEYLKILHVDGEIHNSTPKEFSQTQIDIEDIDSDSFHSEVDYFFSFDENVMASYDCSSYSLYEPPIAQNAVNSAVKSLDGHKEESLEVIMLEQEVMSGTFDDISLGSSEDDTVPSEQTVASQKLRVNVVTTSLVKDWSSTTNDNNPPAIELDLSQSTKYQGDEPQPRCFRRTSGQTKNSYLSAIPQLSLLSVLAPDCGVFCCDPFHSVDITA
mmetsp:Transcript_35804/g.74474  ORF Transcript_35804/g.74474 Transcript_35804/m.74474 type:complete len:257 (+) Transcript_35804:128-898(+)